MRGDGSAGTAGGVGAAAFVTAGRRFFVFAAFIPADFDFRLRAAFFAFAFRFVGMGIPFVTGATRRRPYTAYLRGIQVVQLKSDSMHFSGMVARNWQRGA
jgi:hypothetical protein